MYLPGVMSRTAFLQNVYVEVLTLSTSECGCIGVLKKVDELKQGLQAGP